MSALYVSLICLPYVSALYVSLVCQPYVSALYVCLVYRWKKQLPGYSMSTYQSLARVADELINYELIIHLLGDIHVHMCVYRDYAFRDIPTANLYIYICIDMYIDYAFRDIPTAHVYIYIYIDYTYIYI